MERLLEVEQLLRRMFHRMQSLSVFPQKSLNTDFLKKRLQHLQRIKWWDWSYETIKERMDDFHVDIEKFIEKYDGR